MSVRRRLVLLAAGAVAAAVLVASAAVYVSVRATLRGQVDDSLRSLAPRTARVQALIRDDPGSGASVSLPAPPFGGAPGYAQVTSTRGELVGATQTGPKLPVSSSVREVADGRRAPFLSDQHVDGTHVRVYTARGPAGDVLQVARPLTEVDGSLHRLLWILIGVGVAGVGLAGGFGLLVARGALRPVQRMTETAEHVAATEDLSRRLPADPAGDELDRLGASFNAMLGALESSRAAQRRLVADASHELRTPLTSVLTNVEQLARAPDATEREAMLAAATEQLHELDALIEDLVDLARPEPPAHAVEDVRLDEVVAEEVRRATAREPGVSITVEALPVIVRGVRPRIHRAVGNLLCNAVKHGDGPICVTVSADGELTVDDRGPGIAAAQREHAFDRFWRADEARGLPGSGLGLAIVRHVAESHGGSVAAGDAPGGGARLRLRLPLSPSS
jgi:two-component system sensor histidine kinase MprB